MYVCIYSYSHLELLLAYPKYAQEAFVEVSKQSKSTDTGTDVRVHVFNAGLLARSQFASRRSCDRPTRSRFSVVFLCPRANAELVPKFHVTLLASHVDLLM
jgi:hypothetical protein